MSEIEVLLEVGASCRIFKTTSKSLLLVLERELGIVGLDGVLALSPSACESCKFSEMSWNLTVEEPLYSRCR